MSKDLAAPITYGATTLLAVGSVDMLAHLGPTGLVMGGIAAIVAARHGKDVMEYLRGLFPTASEEELQETARVVQSSPSPARRTIADRLLGRYPDEVAYVPVEQPQPAPAPFFDDNDDESIVSFDADEDDLPRPMLSAFEFSQVLSRFAPRLDSIYLATLPDGSQVTCRAKDLCHVALAGATGGGKSSIMRLLMSQLCKAGASVLLLNPHYTHYDVEHNEDWTPFLPYLVRDPMECRNTKTIAFYLKSIATDLLPKRLDKFAHSQPLGKPYFVVIDELPAIISEQPDVTQYLAKILREGRKVGIYVITAAQDFLVKTIAPQGGGAIRECYRTAYYVGGDATTAKVLLDMPAAQIPEDELGVGVVMMRCATMKKAVQARVPYVDNTALYALLGPSTYVPVPVDEQDNSFLETLLPDTEPHQPVVRPYLVPQPEPEITGHFSMALTPLERAALEVYEEGMSLRTLAQKMTEQGMEIGKDKASDLLRRLRAKKLIA